MSYELRPLSLAEILDAAFRLVQTEWRTLVGLPLIMQIPIVLLGTQASWLFDPFSEPFELGEEPSPELLMQMGLIGTGMVLAYLILYPVVAGAVTAAVGNFYLGRHFTLGEAIRAGLRAIFKLVFSYLAYAVTLAVGVAAVTTVVFLLGAAIGAALDSLGTTGTLLQGLGGIAMVALFFFVFSYAICVSSLIAPVIMLESRGVLSSVLRAFRLGSTSKLRVVGVVFTSGMIVGVPVVGAQMMIGFVPYLGLLIWAAFQAVGFAFTTSVAVVLYFDLRCRAENYDLELLAEQVEAGPGLGQR